MTRRVHCFGTFRAVCSPVFRRWVKWTYQPIERCIVEQVVHDVIHRISYSAQLGSTGGEDAVGQISYSGSLTEAAVDLHGGVADGDGLDLDVLRKTFEAGHQDQTCALKLLA